MSELKRKFGERLRYLRDQAGLTQGQLAEAVGVAEESISNMERGIHGPKFENLEKIVTTLKVPASEFFTFD